jgi:hypothetical protein
LGSVIFLCSYIHLFILALLKTEHCNVSATVLGTRDISEGKNDKFLPCGVCLLLNSVYTTTEALSWAAAD